MAKVPLYDNSGNCLGRVEYTDNLDYWDGSNHTCGSTGRHAGIGKTRSGQYYRVHGTQWQGERDKAVIITEDEAQQLIMSRNDNVLYNKIFGEDIPALD